MGKVYTELMLVVILFGGGHLVPGLLSLPEDLRGIEILMPLFSMGILFMIVRHMKLQNYEVNWMIMFITESFAVGAALAILRGDAPLTLGAFLILCGIGGILAFVIVDLQDEDFPLGIETHDDLPVVFLKVTIVAIGLGIAYTVFYNALVGLATMIAVCVLTAVLFGILYPISYVGDLLVERKIKKYEVARKARELRETGPGDDDGE